MQQSLYLLDERCGKEEKCPFYSRVNMMVRLFKQPELYTPVQYEDIKKRKVDMDIHKIIDFENLLYGGHCCDIAEIRKKRFDFFVFQRCKLATNYESLEPVYSLSYFNWFRQLFNMVFLPLELKNVEEKEKPVSKLLDVKEDRLAEYFATSDILEIFDEVKGSKMEFLNSKEDRDIEYFHYVRFNFSLERRIELYKRFLRKRPVTLPIWANEYDDPTSFLFYFEKQVPMYMDVLRSIEGDDRLYIVGDGPGTASIAAYTVGKRYASNEPNRIGLIAKELGIIKPEPLKPTDIIILFNVLEYIKIEHFINHQKIIIVDENYSKPIEGLGFHPDGAGKVFFKGVRMRDLMLFPLQNSRFMLNRGDKTVKPIDYKAEVLSSIMRLKVDLDNGREVSVTEEQGLNLITRNDPQDKRAKKEGSIKNIRGEMLKVYPGKNILYANDSIVRKFYHDYKTIRYTDNYYFLDGYYYVRTHAPRLLQYIKLRNAKQTIRVYFVKSIFRDGVWYGAFRDVRDLMRGDLVKLPQFDQSHVDRSYSNDAYEDDEQAFEIRKRERLKMNHFEDQDDDNTWLFS